MLDEEQASMMAEECILVDRFDRPTGSASKVIIFHHNMPQSHVFHECHVSRNTRT